MDAEAVAVPASPEIEIVGLPGAIELEVVNLMTAPAAGTLIGNVEVVDNPAGSVLSEMVGVADVPDSVAVTVTKNASLAEMVSGDGATDSVSV